MQREGKLRRRRRMQGRRRKRSGGHRGREKGRRGGWWGQIERGQCKLLSAVRNLRMRSWSVVEKFSLNCLLISISGNGTWTELEEGRQDGKKTSFYFFIFFCKKICLFFLYSVLPSSLLNARLHFHVIHPHLIIQHKVSFSSYFVSFFLF